MTYMDNPPPRHRKRRTFEGRPSQSIADLESRLVDAKGQPDDNAQVRQEIREAGFPHLADELDRIAEQDA